MPWATTPMPPKRPGLNVDRVLATVYLASGLLAALGGFVSVAQQGVVHPGFGEGYEFNAIAAVVLGGTSLFGGVGTVFPGTVLGAVLIQMIQTGLIFTKVDIYLQPLDHGRHHPICHPARRVPQYAAAKAAPAQYSHRQGNTSFIRCKHIVPEENNK